MMVIEREMDILNIYSEKVEVLTQTRDKVAKGAYNYIYYLCTKWFSLKHVLAPFNKYSLPLILIPLAHSNTAINLYTRLKIPPTCFLVLMHFYIYTFWSYT